VSKTALFLVLVAVGAAGFSSQGFRWPDVIARRRVSSDFIEQARHWRVINLAHALAAERIPAGVVLHEDREAIGEMQLPAEQGALLGPALDAFVEKHTDDEVLVAGPGLLFRPRHSACSPAVERIVPAYEDRGSLFAVVQRLVRKASGQPLPDVPPGIVGAGPGPVRGQWPPDGEGDLTRQVTLHNTGATLASLLNDLVAQVPGVVWGVRDHWPGNPPCNLTLFTANRVVSTSEELK
jgi:hypothetical protein